MTPNKYEQNTCVYQISLEFFAKGKQIFSWACFPKNRNFSE